ncbi:MAG: hypothetical protein V4671_25900 [Armatimonadota bacterium]
MILRQALQEQYHAGLAMLADCVEKCPDDLWNSGTHPRTYWRIALHAAYYTHLYLGQSEEAYQPWPERPHSSPELWEKPGYVEPYELPEDVTPYTKQQVLAYIAYIDRLIDPTIETLDLEATETGISWYKNMSKLSHQLLNLRHLQGHVGQLSERLMAREVDIDWMSKASLKWVT